MTLKDYKSLCELRQKQIVSKDNRNPQKHIANNKSLSEVYQYRIDGDVITTGRRCDFLLISDDNNKKNAYLIELKGSDLEHAIGQLEETERVLMKMFSSEFQQRTVFYRIVLNRVRVHALKSNRVKKFQMQHYGKTLFRTGLIEEDI